MLGKYFFFATVIFLSIPIITACSTNPATGDNQFTALMSPQQEISVGAQEHEKVLQQYSLYPDQSLQNYVQKIGSRIVQNTERPDVDYKFFLLDSPNVNAFALPGGYIYLTRGLMTLSNSEAEMAAVLAHEAGHITARHSAERYSRGIVTTLGAAILSTAIGDSSVSQILGLGNDLYIKSYSRGQESQADGLGIRYLSRSGYDPRAMAGFLASLQEDSQLESQLKGHDASNTTDYFSTHPATAERVAQASAQAVNYPNQGTVDRDTYLRRLDGMTYGESATQGFVRKNIFYHPDMGFAFAAPKGFEIMNQPHQVVAQGDNGAVIVFDIVPNQHNLPPLDFIKMVWVQGEAVDQAEVIDINGMAAATASFDGTVNGNSMTVRLVSIEWSHDKMARFMMAIPHGLSRSSLEDLQRTTYSFRRMNNTERQSIRPYRLRIVAAGGGDNVTSLARQMVFDDKPIERFRVLNGLHNNEEVKSGALYKIIVE